MKVSMKAQIFLSGGLEASGKKICLLSVLSGGCNGMQYSIVFLEEPPRYDTTQLTENIYVDNLSLPVLEDCSLELEEKLGFKKIVVKNAKAVSSCSCGSSFSI